MVDLKEVEAFFFKAMSKGWIVGAEEVEIPELPGYKVIIFEEGEFCLVDAYCVNGKKSSGFTTISVEGKPVWTMSHEGWYEKEALPFLKRMLRAAYWRSLFFGGRGYPGRFEEEGMRYLNSWVGEGFPMFRGSENIYKMSIAGILILLGCHEYRGRSLI